jgi:hypothetical protein
LIRLIFNDIKYNATALLIINDISLQRVITLKNMDNVIYMLDTLISILDNYGIFFEILGILFATFTVLIVLIITISVILSYFLVKKDRLIFPKLFLYIMDNFYSLLLKIFLLVGTEDTFYKIGIDFYNKYYADKFSNTKNKILILPHCLRDIKCPAKLGADGIECVFCKKCPLGEIVKTAKENDYRIYIVPGSTFLKRILKENKPDGVFGVACYRDLFYGMNYLSRKGIAPQGQALLKDGCINTMVNVEELIERLNQINNYDNK